MRTKARRAGLAGRRRIAYLVVGGLGMAGSIGFAAAPSSAATVVCHNHQFKMSDGARCAAGHGNNTAIATVIGGGSATASAGNG
jgi:hypothetical protein